MERRNESLRRFELSRVVSEGYLHWQGRFQCAHLHGKTYLVMAALIERDAPVPQDAPFASRTMQSAVAKDTVTRPPSATCTGEKARITVGPTVTEYS